MSNFKTQGVKASPAFLLSPDASAQVSKHFSKAFLHLIFVSHFLYSVAFTFTIQGFNFKFKICSTVMRQ